MLIGLLFFKALINISWICCVTDMVCKIYVCVCGALVASTNPVTIWSEEVGFSGVCVRCGIVREERYATILFSTELTLVIVGEQLFHKHHSFPILSL